MSRSSLYANEIDYAIIKALKYSQEPLRYNKLHKEASDVLGRRIWIKTFNDHLKRLHKEGKVVRNEKSRYDVTYESAKKYTDQERMDIRQEKNLLDLFLEFATKTSDLRLRTRIIQSWIGYLARKRRTVLKILDVILAHAEGKEKEAQMVLDEFFYGYRIVLDHFIKTLSKIDGIAQLVNEMRAVKNRDLEKKEQEFDQVAQELYRITKGEEFEINETNISLLLKFAELHEELTCV